MQISDQQLISELREGNKKDLAFQKLVEKYQERLYWHIRKIVIDHDDADDVMQNTFLKVWKNLHNFREESSIFTWLYRIATNESLTFLNSKKKRSLLPLNEVSDFLMENLESDPYFEGDEIQKNLQKAILSLPEKQRLVFNMKYFDNIKYNDMAEVLDTSVGALKASFHHAVKKIEEYLSNLE
ncbi:MAG: sigma-70 family RNA polymerase sigma factor [Prolixibacteraceae bacterium]|nr:sigma-70 family RNA polymerase sigma factor [Prolixibacteraceae bacterium]